MHTFLVSCVLIEGAFIAFLFWRTRRESQGADSLSERVDSILDALCGLDAKVLDLSEGCARIDSDLEKFVSDLEELGNLRRNDAMEIGERLTQLADDVEKAKRRSSRPATSGNSFDAIRSVAERGASRTSDANHDRMVALAEGS